MTEFSKRIKWYMDEQNLRQVDIIERCKHLCEERSVKLNRSDLSQYINGIVTPGEAKLNVIADSLGVNPAWLKGYDVPMVEFHTPVDEYTDQRIKYYCNQIVSSVHANQNLIKSYDHLFELNTSNFYKVIEYIDMLYDKEHK